MIRNQILLHHCFDEVGKWLQYAAIAHPVWPQAALDNRQYAPFGKHGRSYQQHDRAESDGDRNDQNHSMDVLVIPGHYLK